MKRYIKPFGLILILVLVCQVSTANDPEVIIDSQKTRVFMSNEYTYYGIDFSKFVLVNKAKMHQGEKIKHEFLPAWIAEFSDMFTEKYLSSRLEVDVLNDERVQFQEEQYMRNDPSSIVNYQSTPWNAGTLSSIVQDYQLERQSGIGISFIIAEFNKYEETIIGYVTFFDIETRELMYVVEGRGAGTGMGMTNHWLYGLRAAWDDYFYKDFGKDKRRAIKAAKKAAQ